MRESITNLENYTYAVCRLVATATTTTTNLQFGINSLESVSLRGSSYLSIVCLWFWFWFWLCSNVPRASLLFLLAAALLGTGGGEGFLLRAEIRQIDSDTA